jgi:hypothetical protein
VFARKCQPASTKTTPQAVMAARQGPLLWWWRVTHALSPTSGPYDDTYSLHFLLLVHDGYVELESEVDWILQFYFYF